MSPRSLLGRKQFVTRRIVDHSGEAASLLARQTILRRPAFQRHRYTEHRISVRKIRRAVERIDVPSVVAALIVQPLLFAEHVMQRKLLADALADERLGSAVGGSYQIGVTLVLNLQSLVEILQEQRACLACDGRHGGEETFGME